MEAILPLNVLKDIFTLYLCVDDVASVYDTCLYWRDIIDNFNIWKKQWLRLVVKSQNSCLREQINRINPKNLQYSCIKLKNILSNKYINSCIENDNKQIDVVLLKTHHSHFLQTYYKIHQTVEDTLISCEYHKPILNPNKQNHLQYVNFRSRDEIIRNINRVNIYKNIHKNREKIYHSILTKQFWYVYPLKLTKFIEEELLGHFFDVYHVKEIIFIPRVLMLCENLNVSDALVIFSTSQTTEIAVVLNGRVAAERLCELPIAGWNMSRNLHNAIKWIYPDAVDVCEMEDILFKTLCWIKPTSNMSDNHLEVHSQINNSYFTLKKEQYLAAELMYTELNLCSVIGTLFDGLCDEDISNCLSHVFLTGGNCKLKHLSTRIKLDLIQAYPKFQNVISTSVHCAQPLIYEISNNIYSFISSLNPDNQFHAGKICKIRIEDYISPE